MSLSTALADRIEDHRIAWHDWFRAPAFGRAADRATKRRSDAMNALLETPARSFEDAVALRDHLAWYVEAEGQSADVRAVAMHAALYHALQGIGGAKAGETWIDF